MAWKDYTDSHVAIAVGATAMVCSSRMRKLLRRGAVHGVAGALMAGDAVASFARGVGRGAQQAAASAPPVMEADTDGADAPVAHDGVADVPSQVDVKANGEADASSTQAHLEHPAHLVEANADE